MFVDSDVWVHRTYTLQSPNIANEVSILIAITADLCK